MYPAKQRIDLELGVNPTEREVFDLLKSITAQRSIYQKL